MGMISDFKDFALGSDLGIPLTDGAEPIMLKWGAFVQSFIDFIIIMAVVFIIVKIATRNKVEEEPGPSQEDLLTEIRDALQK